MIYVNRWRRKKLSDFQSTGTMGWIRKEIHGNIIYQCKELNNSVVVQAFSTKGSGNMALHTGDKPENVIARRESFLNSIGLGLDDLVAGKQMHGTNIAVIEKNLRGSGSRSYENAIPETDSLIAREPGIILSVFTADCVPIFIFDPETPAVGIVHAGWRGTINLIAGLTLKKMMAEFKTDPGKCLVAIGPAIGEDCFEVAPDLADKFIAVHPEIVIKNLDRYVVDLSALNSIILQETGVNPANIFDSGICTVCQSKEFYSYRAEKGIMGRMMGVIALK